MVICSPGSGLQLSATHMLPKRFSQICSRDPESPNREKLLTRRKTFLGAKWRCFMASLAMDGNAIDGLPSLTIEGLEKASHLSIWFREVIWRLPSDTKKVDGKGLLSLLTLETATGNSQWEDCPGASKGISRMMRCNKFDILMYWVSKSLSRN